jgi:methylmalonic aciduria homocystinuria type C protein
MPDTPALQSQPDDPRATALAARNAPDAFDPGVVTRTLANALAPRGFDLTRAVAVSAYNHAVAPPLRLPDHGRAGALAVVIGNTRALWPRFVAALRADAALAEDRNPLDRYTELAVAAAVHETAGVLGGPPREIRFAHEAPPRRVAMQRLAHLAGLAHLTPGQLCVHPVYGPWIALRAVVVWDIDAGADAATTSARIPPPCDCSRGCARAFDRTVAAVRGLPTQADVRADWQRWVAVRDACPVGREHRYSAEQIRYHYTGDREILRRAIAERDPRAAQTG